MDYKIIKCLSHGKKTSKEVFYCLKNKGAVLFGEVQKRLEIMLSNDIVSCSIIGNKKVYMQK